MALYLGLTLMLALSVRRRVGSMDDFVVAGRRLGPALSVASLVGGELGLVTVMYSAQKGVTGGLAALHIPLVAGGVTLMVGLTGCLVVPLRKTGVATIPEFYERRFGAGVRVLGGMILALSGILNMGLFLKAGSVFVTGVTGLDSPFELKLTMTVLLALVLVYVVSGGMLAVVLTDFVQFVLLSLGLLLAAGLALRQVGWSQLVEVVDQVHGEAGFDPLHSGGFGPSYVVWMIFTAGLVSSAIWQPAVLRALSAESTAVVRRLYVWSSIGFVIRFLLPNLIGLCALTWVVRTTAASAAFQAAGGVASPEATLQLMPVYLGQLLPTGVLGLVVAGLLAAFMSTHDSYLLSWASVITQDVVAPLWPRPLADSVRLRITRATVLVIGMFLLFWSLWYPLEQDLWDYMAVTGAIYFTGAFAVLMFGLYWSRASTVGAYLALLGGFTGILGMAPVRSALGLSLSGEQAGLLAVALCVSLMVVGSVAFPDRGAREVRV